MAVKDIIRAAKAFLWNELERSGSVVRVEPSEAGWETWVDVIEERKDLSVGYRRVYEHNIYKIDLDRKLKVLSYRREGRKDMERQRGEVKGIGKETAEKIAKKISKPGGVTKEKKIEPKETFLDPTEDVEMEYNFERLGEIQRSNRNIKNSIGLLKGFKKGKK